MKAAVSYTHLNAKTLLSSNGKLINEVELFFSDPSLIFGRNHPSSIKKVIADKFNNCGWADKVSVSNSKLTISYLKNKCGVCFQLGNVARTYADVLKLMQLHYKGIIIAGIIVVPLKAESRKLGTNYAQYDRLENELRLYKDIIKVPIYLIGLSN